MMSLRHLLEPLDGVERRAQRRYPIRSDVAFTVVSEEQEYGCVVEDVSLGGIRLRLDHDVIEPDSEIHFSHPFLGKFSAHSLWTKDHLVGIVVASQESAVRICVHCLKQLVPAEDLA